MGNRVESKNASRFFFAGTQASAGFSLLELIIVMFLMALIAALSTVFFMNSLPSGAFRATAREMATSVRHARALAQTKGETQTVTVDLDSRKYAVEGRGEKALPPDISIKVIDPFSDEVREGKYDFTFHALGGSGGGTIVLSHKKKTVNIHIDPVAGVAMTGGE